ncbi:MAG: hypothetical protein P8L35_00785 [Acidimicrobiales bacterium]|nr:hypothetical protein [Acidimicrobiales bacterium]
MELTTIRKWIGSFITLLLFTLVTSSCGENSDSETIRKLQTQVDTLSNQLAEANSTTTPTETTPTTTPTETTSESVKTITEDSEINLDEVVIDTEVGRVLNSSDWRTNGEFPWTDLSWSEPGELIAGDSSACELKNVGSVLVTGISPGTCFVKIGATEIVSREPLEKGKTEYRVFQINVDLGPGVPEIVPDEVFDIKVGKVLFQLDWKQHFPAGDRWYTMPLLEAGDSSACELSNVEGPHVTGISPGTCFVRITSSEGNLQLDRGKTEYRIFQINVTPRTEDAQQPLPVTTLEYEPTSTTADSCIEAFIFEQSTQPSDQSAVAEYTFSQREDDSLLPVNSDPTIKLSIIPCESVPYLSSVTSDFKLEVGVDLILETFPESLSGSDFELVWIDWQGTPKVITYFNDHGLTEVNTLTGHPFYIRYKTPEHRVDAVDNCDSAEMRRPLKFSKRVFGGWNVYFECVIAYQSAFLSKIETDFADDLQYINSLLPTKILNELKESTDIFVILTQEASGTAKMDYWEGGAFYKSPFNRNQPGRPAGYEGSIVVDAKQWNNTRRDQPAVLLHEIAHAWHCINWVQTDGGGDPNFPAGTEQNPFPEAIGCFFGDTQISEAYEAAMSAGIYDAVHRRIIEGAGESKLGEDNLVEAYAATARTEYFAELTEAWFWENDYYPHNREELLEHDPLGVAAIKAAWNSSP